MKTILKYMLILPLLAGTSCLREPFDDDVVHRSLNDERNVMFQLGLPYAAQRPATRSIGEEQESAIETLDLLAFKVEGGVETFQYRAEATYSGSGATYNAKVRAKKYEQRFVLVSNAREKIENLIYSRIDRWVDADKEAMLARLTFDLNDSDRWKALDNTNYTAIPMWGETAPKIISEAINSISDNKIQMLRMIAKIEVQLDNKQVANLKSKFQLKSVHVFHTNTSGRIVPKPGAEYIKDMAAQKASLPASVETVLGPIVYDERNTSGITDEAIKGEIYLFETAAKNADNFLEETCIVVGGVYENHMSYYRLDFFKDDGKTHWDILRNHAYICNIVDVTGPGSPSVEEAFLARTYKIKAEILAWNEGGIKDIVFDGQYMLGVSHDRIELDEDAHDVTSSDNILKITTDYPDGWTAAVWDDKGGTVSVPDQWLNIDKQKSSGGVQPEEMRLIVTENTGAERTGYVHIKTGRLTYVVTVVQNPAGTITVTDYLILGHKAQSPAVQKLTVYSRKFNGDNNPNASWTLTVPPTNDWLTLSLTGNTGTNVKSVSGTGTQDIYVFVTSNAATNSIDREEEVILLNSKGEKIGVSTIRQNKDLPASEPVNARSSAVGAFWRWNQTGERIIQIDVGANSGDWMATVSFYDSKWNPENGDGVLLAASGSDDENIGTNNPDDAENHQLSGNDYTSRVEGTAAANGKITFRIGLQSQFTAYHADNNPARYAVIELWYANNKKMQRIYLRQGEGADYVMNRYAPDNRPLAVKISPFNLTADKKNTLSVDKCGTASGANPGKFVEYPSQAGAFFQWANAKNRRFAWDFTSATLSNWNSVRETKWSDEDESCPCGYRRPNDNTNQVYSEIRQSLWLTPQPTVSKAPALDNKDNYIFGYYADGFYDRRPLDNYKSTEWGASTGVAAKDTDEAAFGGGLFFNPVTNASVFFPLSSYREGVYGRLQSASTGFVGYYLTKYLDYDSNTYALSMRNEDWLVMYPIDKAQGSNIRCVKE